MPIRRILILKGIAQCVDFTIIFAQNMKNSIGALAAQPIKIGIIIGAGTGRRLAVIFKEFLSKLAEKHGISVAFIEAPSPNDSPPYYHSYQSLDMAAGGDFNEFKKISKLEVLTLVKTVKEWYEEGVKAIFRTSINAETLYLFRQEMRAIKEFSLSTLHGRRILFVRDQTEGFYANTTYSMNEASGEILFEGKYTRKHQQDVIRYATQWAQKTFQDQPFEKWAIYKHHLFGDTLKKWIHEEDKNISVYQPDTGLTELHRFFNPLERRPQSKNLLVVCSNEVGDIIYESLIENWDLEAKLMFYSKNIYMIEPFSGNFGDYQTVHGSADDKVLGKEFAEEEEILPYSMFFAASEIAENYLSIPEILRHMKVAVSIARRGSKRTNEITRTIFSHFHIEYNG